MEKSIRFAFFGCGRAGKNHLEVLCNTPDAEVVAVCDIRKDVAEKTAEEFGIPAVYSDAKELFENEKIDAIANITSTGGHYPLTMLAAKYGVHVFLEKPMATSFEQAEEMVTACRKAGIILAVTYTYRFVPETREIKNIIDSGILGHLLEVRFLKYGGSPYKYPLGTDERRQRDALNTKECLGIVYDCGGHAIDLLCWYAGADPVKIEAWGTHHEGYDYPDTATCLLKFANGVKGVFDDGSLTGSFKHFGEGIPLMFIIVNGEKGSVIYSLAANTAGRDNNTSYLEVLTEKQHTVKTYPLYGKCRDIQYQQFIQSVRAGKLMGNFPSPEEAALATKVTKEMLQLCLKNRVNSPLI